MYRRQRRRGEHKVSALGDCDGRIDIFDDTDELVSDPGGFGVGCLGTVRMQVGAADAGRGDSHQRVGWLPDHGVGHVFDPDVTGSVEDDGSHLHLLL
jgi:hypothetical protein